MNQNKPTLLKITVFFLVLQIILILKLFGQGQHSYAQSVIATTCFWSIYTFLEARYGFYMNTYIRIMVIITLLSDSFFGCYLDLYTKSSIFDKLLHVFGTYSFSLFAYVLAVQLLTHPINPLFKFILVVSLGVSLGAFYEILEFVSDTFSHPIPVNQPSLLDTDLDLIGDAMGANIAAVHAISKAFMNHNF